MAAELRGGGVLAPGAAKARPRARIAARKRLRAALTPRVVRLFGVACLVASACVALRQFRLVAHVARADRAGAPANLRDPETVPDDDDDDDGDDDDDDDALLSLKAAEDSVNLWRKVDTNLPPEADPPDPALYGTGAESCYSLGLPDAVGKKLQRGDPASFWQMNSRALCYSAQPVCLYGRSLEHLMSFEKRGSGRCHVVAVEKGQVLPAREHGLNESCAAWRRRQVATMFGKEVFSPNFANWEKWTASRVFSDPRRHSVEWESDFAIVVPKYDWSYNICHYNRIWNFIVYVIRNLNLFVPDADRIRTIDVRFRSGYAYKELWHVGIRDATLPALMRETGKKITVGKIRFDYLREFQCIKRGVLLGREGRIDAFPFYNDTPVWRPEHQLNDTHWPIIPHDSLWLREVVLQANQLPSAGVYTGPGIKNFLSIPVPPLRVAVLQRSPRSRRRLSLDAGFWFRKMLNKLCAKYRMELVPVRTSSMMTLGQQVKQVSQLGLAVGLHGANMVNTMFMPAGAAVFEIFPWRYVRYYYAGGGNTGLRYSFHEPEGGIDRHCSFESKTCFMHYRESVILLTDKDKKHIHGRLEKAMKYLHDLHRRHPEGSIPLRREGNVYRIDR